MDNVTKVEAIIEKFPKEIHHIIKQFSLNEIESSFGFLLNELVTVINGNTFM